MVETIGPAGASSTRQRRTLAVRGYALGRDIRGRSGRTLGWVLLGAIRARHRVAWYCRPSEYTDADPLKLIVVDPAVIVNQQRPICDDPRVVAGLKDGFHKWKSIGLVVDGTWDEHTIPMHELVKFSSLTAHFAQGVPWLETEFVREVLAGRRVWNRCKTEEDVLRRGRELDRLFDQIRFRGYRSRIERRDWDLWHQAIDEVTVNIGRHGELIRNNGGTHRLAIAKALGVEHVPARVLIRHHAWQAVREAVRRTNEVPSEYVNHPDLLDVARTGRETAR